MIVSTSAAEMTPSLLTSNSFWKLGVVLGFWKGATATEIFLSSTSPSGATPLPATNVGLLTPVGESWKRAKVVPLVVLASPNEYVKVLTPSKMSPGCAPG